MDKCWTSSHRTTQLYVTGSRLSQSQVFSIFVIFFFCINYEVATLQFTCSCVNNLISCTSGLIIISPLVAQKLLFVLCMYRGFYKSPLVCTGTWLGVYCIYICLFCILFCLFVIFKYFIRDLIMFCFRFCLFAYSWRRQQAQKKNQKTYKQRIIILDCCASLPFSKGVNLFAWLRVDFEAESTAPRWSKRGQRRTSNVENQFLQNTRFNLKTPRGEHIILKIYWFD